MSGIVIIVQFKEMLFERITNSVFFYREILNMLKNKTEEVFLDRWFVTVSSTKIQRNRVLHMRSPKAKEIYIQVREDHLRFLCM